MVKKSVKMDRLFDIPLFGGGEDEVLKIVEAWITKNPLGGRGRWIATVNPEFVMKAERDEEFAGILQSRTDLNTIDGIGLVWGLEVKKRIWNLESGIWNIKKFLHATKVGMEVLSGKYKDRVVAGSSLMESMCAKKWRVFFLGGWENRAEKTKKYFEKKYKGLMAESCPGEPTIENSEVIKKINKFKPDILLVAYGMSKQEKWIVKNLAKLKVRVAMGVGRSFDYYSGAIKRAPVWVRNMGMEWLYSLIKDPKRLKRQLVLPRFVGRVLKTT